MHQEALKIDFDVAIIGYGVYGMSLAMKLREIGKSQYIWEDTHNYYLA